MHALARKRFIQNFEEMSVLGIKDFEEMSIYSLPHCSYSENRGTCI